MQISLFNSTVSIYLEMAFPFTNEHALLFKEMWIILYAYTLYHAFFFCLSSWNIMLSFYISTYDSRPNHLLAV